MATIRFSRKQGNLAKGLVMGLYNRGTLVALSSLTNPVIKFRRVMDSRGDAVEGAGTLAAYTDTENTPAIYNVSYTWDASDPDDPGDYFVEIDAVDGSGQPITFPDPDVFVLTIAEDAG